MKINRNKPIWVYRNLRHGHKSIPLYSIMQNGRVVKRAHRILLTSVKFIVRESGRQRVLREGRKNVHAFAVGFMRGSAAGTDSKGKLPVKIGYNPYKGSTFFCTMTTNNLNTPVTGAAVLILNEYGMTGAYIQ
jgi:hypothetical protein